VKYKRDFEVEVKRTNRRKTATLKIHEGVVQVIVPQRLPQQAIDDLIQKKADWIRKKLMIVMLKQMNRKKIALPKMKMCKRIRVLTK